MSQRFVIIGGDAAGMSAASKARRVNPQLEIDVFEKGPWISYGACGLPYYIQGKVKDITDLVARTPEEFSKKYNINVFLHHEVMEINVGERIIKVNCPDGMKTINFDNLLISTGALPVQPNIEGIKSPGVFTLRSMESARQIRYYLDRFSPRSVLVIGGGYIGIEMLEVLHSLGLKVSLVERLPHVLNSFGQEICETVEQHIRQFARLYLNESVKKITQSTNRQLLVKTDHKKIETDLVLIATGVRPNIGLANTAGIKLGETGAIGTDQYGQTSEPHIYAAGDCAEVKHSVTGKADYIPLALSANRNGRAIGSTVAGVAKKISPAAGTAVLKAFQLEVARTGIIIPENARKHHFDPVKVTIDSHTRAGYYPGAKPIKISIMADSQTRQVLGASMVGEEGVAKRIDTVATGLYAGLTISQLENLDLAYAPPFGPSWDPVLIAARVLSGRLSKK